MNNKETTDQEVEKSIKEHLQTQCGFDFDGYRFIYKSNGKLEVFKRINENTLADKEENPFKVADLLMKMINGDNK